VLRKIFGHTRDKVTGEWRRIHIKEFYNLYFSPNIIWVNKSRRMRCVGHVGHMRESGNAHRVLVGKPETEKPLERPRHRWEDNIKMDLQEVEC
jgi:hypothetical protein